MSSSVDDAVDPSAPACAEPMRLAEAQRTREDGD
jgi:hypothetical protein